MPSRLLALTLGCCFLTPAFAADITSTAQDTTGIAVTVYNSDLALIKETRKLTLGTGTTRIALRDVSAQMRPETALLRSVGGGALSLVEQNFDFDLLTPEKLLEKYVGKAVTVIRTHPTTGEEKRETATVLSANGGTVLKFADRIETGVPGRLAFADVPANLRDVPTLSVLVEGNAGPHTVELSYLSGGLGWKADYVANLNSEGNRMDLSGWVTLTNNSGTGYSDATLQLVAGTVNRVQPMRDMAMMAMPAPAPVGKRAEMAQENLMDYHLYTFDRPTSIADRQTKQLALTSATGIPVRREYLLAGSEWMYRDRYAQTGQKIKPAVFIEFDNKGGQLGKPLPAGILRIYAKDSKGGAQFVGEDRIGHTAKNETVRLKLGEAFDITGERKQTSYRKIADNTSESAYRIDLRNAKDEAVSVRVQETLPGDWEITQESQKHSKDDARQVSWLVTVPASGSATLEYSARVRW